MTIDQMIAELSKLKGFLGGETRVHIAFQPKAPRTAEIGTLVANHSKDARPSVIVAASDSGRPAESSLIEALEW